MTPLGGLSCSSDFRKPEEIISDIQEDYARICAKSLLLLLLMLSRFSRVRLCATPRTAAHEAPPSLRFSRQEHWSGLPFPFSMHESEKGK